MRYFRYGPRFGLSTKELSYTRVKEWDNGTTLLSVEAQICTVNSKSTSSPNSVPRQKTAKYSASPTDFEASNLCLRIQDIMLIIGNAIDLLPPPEKVFMICDHISQTPLSHIIFSHILSSTAREREVPYFPSYFNTCSSCNTDYQVELHRLGQNGLALVITRWLNLGAGLTPEDPQWRVHTHSWPPKCMNTKDVATLTSPRMLFEASLPKKSSVEALRSYNLSMLKDHNYRTMMNQEWWPRDVWEYRGEPIKQSTEWEAFNRYLRVPCLKEQLRIPREQQEMKLWRHKDEVRLSRQRAKISEISKAKRQ
ncbi:F-box domain-containing protein [Penicillium sp. IBT 31633x]|nr:F-box domain-containing protein [Penicillium sp. IBT 31633x]